MVHIRRIGTVVAVLIAVTAMTAPAFAHDEPTPAGPSVSPPVSPSETPAGAVSGDPRANPDRFVAAPGSSVTVADVLVNDVIGNGEAWDVATLTVTFPGRDIRDGILVTTADDAGRDLPGTYWVCTVTGRCVTAPVMVTITDDQHGPHWPVTVLIVAVTVAGVVAAGVVVVAAVAVQRRRRNLDPDDENVS